MNTKESLPHALGRKALDAMIRREYDGWPPKTQWSLYQPHRPEKKPSEPEQKPFVIQPNILLPVASCMQRAFF